VETAGQDICIRCGYDLAGLKTDGLCPECALPVARSRERVPLLRAADREWLRTVTRGLASLDRALWCLLWLLLAGVMSIFMLMGLENSGLPSEIGRWLGLVGAAAFVFMLVVAGLWQGRGVWLISVPTHAEYSLPDHIRLCVRVCGIVLPVTGAVTLLQIGPALPRSSLIPVHLGCQVNALVYFLALAVGLRYFEERSAGWGAELQRKHRNLRKNLVGLAILVLLFDWAAGRGGRGSWGEVFLGVAYVFFLHSTVGRTLKAVRLELAVAEHGAEADAARDVLRSARHEDADAAAPGVGGTG
jgi:hypothetical protein